MRKFHESADMFYQTILIDAAINWASLSSSFATTVLRISLMFYMGETFINSITRGFFANNGRGINEALAS